MIAAFLLQIHFYRNLPLVCSSQERLNTSSSAWQVALCCASSFCRLERKGCPEAHGSRRPKRRRGERRREAHDGTTLAGCSRRAPGEQPAGRPTYAKPRARPAAGPHPTARRLLPRREQAAAWQGPSTATRPRAEPGDGEERTGGRRRRRPRPLTLSGLRAGLGQPLRRGRHGDRPSPAAPASAFGAAHGRGPAPRRGGACAVAGGRAAAAAGGRARRPPSALGPGRRGCHRRAGSGPLPAGPRGSRGLTAAPRLDPGPGPPSPLLSASWGEASVTACVRCVWRGTALVARASQNKRPSSRLEEKGKHRGVKRGTSLLLASCRRQWSSTERARFVPDAAALSVWLFPTF